MIKAGSAGLHGIDIKTGARYGAVQLSVLQWCTTHVPTGVSQQVLARGQLVALSASTVINDVTADLCYCVILKQDLSLQDKELL